MRHLCLAKGVAVMSIKIEFGLSVSRSGAIYRAYEVISK